MSEVKSTSSTSTKTTPMVFHLDVELPSTGNTLRVAKLKAGKYYEAQKLYVQWLQELQNVLENNVGDSEKLQDAIDEKGVIDEKKLKKIVTNKSTINVSDMLSAVDIAASKRIELLSVCLGVTKEELEEQYYPEDLDILMEKCVELNNFMENVKKSVAPTGGGAVAKK